MQPLPAADPPGPLLQPVDLLLRRVPGLIPPQAIRVRVIVTLGAFAYEALWTVLRDDGVPLPRQPLDPDTRPRQNLEGEAKPAPNPGAVKQRRYRYRR